MGPIEIFFLTVVLIFGVIGLVRGSARELGNSIILMFVVAILGLTGELGWIDRLVTQLEIFGTTEQQLRSASFVLISTLFLLIVLASYQGRTFDFSSQRVTGLWAALSGLLAGLLNGYLCAGTVWHYADLYAYPFNALSGPLTATGQQLLGLLPQAIFPTPMLWAVPATALMLVRILK